MRTNNSKRTRVPGHARLGLFAGGVVVVSAISLQAIVGSTGPAAGPIDPSLYRLPADDQTRLSDVTFGEQPTVALPAAAAEKVAGDLYDPAALGATSVDAYLATITVPATARSATPVENQGVWIVRLTGMSQEQPGPITADGVPAQSHFLHRAYVFVDAVTGEFLFTEWQE
jgi:hypothetical protein